MSLSELQSYFGSGVSEVRRYYDAGRWKYTVYGKGEKGERISFFADEPHNIHLTDQAYPPGDPRRHPFGKKG
jgi:hypothetical protein